MLLNYNETKYKTCHTYTFTLKKKNLLNYEFKNLNNTEIIIGFYGFPI